MTPDTKRPADQAIGRGNALPEETADLPSKGGLRPGAARAAEGNSEVAPATPVPMFSPGELRHR